ncbi:hypothetical protein CEP54_015142 [Fusarium duplospermum]|uniref:Zn(2)-C6 fungal-type domain-containing protein n=1 Tax=Fusarium duplospermum TaxID=1325734 RepID=A0A428NRA8_9HYPO|nr:hypothetical protein CEP54_015142 [Fusarium duplospermum]
MSAFQSLVSTLLGCSTGASPSELFVKSDPTVDGDDCLHDCDSCTVQYPKKFKVETSQALYGNIKGWSTHLLVATTKSDWVRNVANEKGSIMEAVDKARELRNGKLMLSASNMPTPDRATDYSRPTSALLLPTFVLINNIVPKNANQLIGLIDAALTTSSPLTASTLPVTVPSGDPTIPDISTKSCPHEAIILLCSQRSRDARCSQSAPLLRKEFERHLRPLGLYRDLDDERPGGVGIYFISHVGGHKYSANVMVYRRHDAFSRGYDLPMGQSHGNGENGAHDLGAAQCICSSRSDAPHNSAESVKSGPGKSPININSVSPPPVSQSFYRPTDSGTMHRRSRTNPRPLRTRVVSCLLCRERKLRCNRQFPCTNCTARGVQCQAPPTARGREATPPADPRVSNEQLLRRLESLEALLATRTSQRELPSSEPSFSEDTGQQQFPSNVQNWLSDALLLERLCMGPKAGDLTHSNPIVVRTCPVRLITRPWSFIFQNEALPSLAVQPEPLRCLWLPDRQEAKRLVDKYISDISFIHHVIHGPSVRRLVDQAYDTINQGNTAPMGPIALLIAIFANSTCLWTAQDLSRNLFCGVSEARSQASLWQKAGIDVLDHIQQSPHVSLESTQALVILCYSIVNLEGVSVKYGALFSRAITMARELGLHCIDSPRQVLGHRSGFTKLEAEVGRRIWWYLCTTDWILAGLSGTLGGAYTIHPSQMAVHKPQNVDDEDCIDGEEIVGRPMDQPTCMSYFLERIRFAEIFRASLESAQFAALSPDTISFQLVQELEARMSRFWDDAPAFLCFTHASSVLNRSTSKITIQGYILNLFVHGQRCRAHLPYLARGQAGPAYATSRAACVESARLIIRMEMRMEEEEHDFASTRLRMSIVLHHIFLAFLVLLLDICLDTNGPRQISKSPEAAVAWRILQDAKAQSQQASTLVEPLG